MIFVVYLMLLYTVYGKNKHFSKYGNRGVFDLVLYVAKTPFPKNGDHGVFDFFRYVRGKRNTVSYAGWFSILYVVGTVKDEA